MTDPPNRSEKERKYKDPAWNMQFPKPRDTRNVLTNPPIERPIHRAGEENTRPRLGKCDFQNRGTLRMGWPTYRSKVRSTELVRKIQGQGLGNVTSETVGR